MYEIYLTQGAPVLEMVFIKIKNNKHKLSLTKTNKRLFRLNLANQVTLHYGKRRSALKELAFTVSNSNTH